MIYQPGASDNRISFPPRIERLPIGGKVRGVPGDDDELMYQRGGGDHAVHHIHGETFRLVLGVELAPGFEREGVQSEQLVCEVILETLRPLGQSPLPFSFGQSVQAFSNLSERQAGEETLAGVGLDPCGHARFRMLGRGLADHIGIQELLHRASPKRDLPGDPLGRLPEQRGQVLGASPERVRQRFPQGHATLIFFRGNDRRRRFTMLGHGLRPFLNRCFTSSRKRLLAS